MTNEQEKAKELAQLLTAFADGKQLQYKDGEWYNYSGNYFKAFLKDFADNYSIRIKPETKRIRIKYNFNDDLVGKIVIEKNKSCVVKRMIISQDRISVLVSNYQNETDMAWYSYEQLLEFFTWADGTPCYKEVECEF